MIGVRKAKGHPLWALAIVLGGWIMGRTMWWEAPLIDFKASAAPVAHVDAVAQDTGFVFDSHVGPQSSQFTASPAGSGPVAGLSEPVRCCEPGMERGILKARLLARASDWRLGGEKEVAFTLAGGRGRVSPQPAGQAVAAAPAPGGMRAVAAAASAPPARARRWSMDAWALFRRNSAIGLSPGVLPGTYGASQSGAVTRYRLDMTSPHRPTAYLRTTTALAGSGESTAALGVAARPLPQLPLVAAAEGRWTRFPGGSVIQPAVFAYTEIPPISLPAALRAEAYFQGGYVAGRFPTVFVDGQVRVDRQVVRVDAAELRVGGGVWGGAQTGVSRLDFGPSASLSMPLGRGLFGRVAADWRFRAVGNARPGSGPAITLSAGF